MVSDLLSGLLAALVSTNTPAAVSNLVQFSQAMGQLAGELTGMVASNKLEFNQAIGSLEATARVLERLSLAVEQGQGLAGALLKDPQLKESFTQTARNLQTVSSNLSYHGLLYKPRHPKSEAPNAPPAFPPKSPFK